MKFIEILVYTQQDAMTTQTFEDDCGDPFEVHYIFNTDQYVYLNPYQIKQIEYGGYRLLDKNGEPYIITMADGDEYITTKGYIEELLPED